MITNTISIFGGSARNKGALLMLDSTLKLLNKKGVKKVIIFTPFLKEDEKFINIYKPLFNEIEIIAWNQKSIINSLLVGIFRLKITKINKALHESDIVIDISGISFVSKRGYKHFLYNCISIYLPSLFVKKIIKYPQSFGPLKGIDKYIAKYFLNKCTTIFSRGYESKSTLDRINIKSTLISDLGFLNHFDELTNKGRFIGVQPSIVVKKYFDNNNINYENFLVNLINSMSNLGYEIIIFPQAVHSSDRSNLFDDVSIIKSLESKIDDKNVTFIKKDMDLEELFEIYKKLKICITSRFHGMIMSLVSNVIPMVIGWNHKYHEILMSFNFDDLGFEIKEDINQSVEIKFHEVVKKYDDYVERLIKNKNDYSNESVLLLKSLD